MIKQNISVIIVHYNTPERLRRCLSHLSSVHDHLEIVVVDNASGKSLEDIQQHFHQVKFIKNTRNEGFSFANNQGFLHTTGSWLLFLNPDVEITAKQVYDLYHQVVREGYDAVSPKTEDERYQKPLPSFLSLFQEFSPLRVVSIGKTYQTLTGGCLMIKRTTFEQLGGWDERFFLWFEDSDLTQRLIKRGARIGFVQAELTHHGGDSFKVLSKQLQRDIFFNSMEIYVRKHFSYWQQVLIRQMVIKRFTKTHLYPQMNKGSSWVVPNMRRELLSDFLEVNERFFHRDQHLIIVSSSLPIKLFWQLKRQYPSVRLIRIYHNKGFTSTVNIGFRASTTEFVGTVNDDVIANERTFTVLQRFAKTGFGSVNPVISSLNGNIESAGIELLKKGKAVPSTRIPRSDVTVVQATNGACVLYLRKALQKVGLLDERLGSYLEDIEMSIRLKKARYSHALVTSSRIIHLKHQTSRRFGAQKQWLDMKNWWLISLKHYSFSDWVFHFPEILLERGRNLSGFMKKLARG